MKKTANLKTYKRAFETAEAVCSRAADGDLEARITNTEEFGELGQCLNAINRMLDQVDAYVRESSASLEYAASANTTGRSCCAARRGIFVAVRR